MSSIGATKLTYESFMALPETKDRYDVVDGVLRVAPSPTLYHQMILMRLAALLHLFVDRNALGVVLPAPCDLIVQRDPLRVRQPDIMYLNAERTGIRSVRDLIGLANAEMPPDLVVEIWSPSNTPRIVEDRLNDYRRIRVLECWLVDPETETVRVLDLSEVGATETRFRRAQTLESDILPGFTLPLEEVFSG